VDWGDGDYARTARALAPVAGVILDALAVVPGERVLDVASGTGNAALAAAARGARAVGVDGAEGLLALARDRAREADEEVEFLVGDAGALPVEDDAFDVVLSAFGVIFAPDPEQAAAELLRVLRPGGRLALTTWVPAGAIHDVGRVLFGALPARPGDRPRWGDADWVLELLTSAGAREVHADEDHLTFKAASPEAWFSEQEEHHPVWRWGRRVIGDERWSRVREESIAALEAANEDPAAFRATSRYLVVTAER